MLVELHGGLDGGGDWCRRVRHKAAALVLYLVAVTPASALDAGVATAHPLATEAGLAILGQGGNAFDAAVVVTAVLAVVEPQSSGLGGGGFYLLHRASDDADWMLDAREAAPLAADPDLYLDAAGRVDHQASLDGPLAAGIPGIPAALGLLTSDYARLPLDRTLAAAIQIAEDGFEVDAGYAKLARLRLGALQASAAAARQFLDQGQPPAPGFRLVQKDLAETLRRIASDGAAGFYRGPVAAQLVAAVREAGGIWTSADLQRYRTVIRPPVVSEYRGARVISASLPSSGGLVIAEVLNQLSGYPLQGLSRVDRAHLTIEAMRRAYRDRAVYMGDPDFVAVPTARLLSRDYAAGLRASIRLDRASRSADLPGVTAVGGLGADTTHFSIVDGQGNRVAATLSINYPFGSGFVAPGTGVLLNNEMDDFAAAPGVGNVYGLVGSAANAIGPGKRPLSSMSPTFVELGSKSAILGTPGGSRIISMVTLAILDFIDGNGPASWVGLPRYHHQYLPDRVQFEAAAFDAAEVASLQRRGHRMQRLSSGYGNMQALLIDGARGRVVAASDPRSGGLACTLSETGRRDCVGGSGQGAQMPGGR